MKDQNANIDDLVLNGIVSLLEKDHYWKGTMTLLSKHLVKSINKKYVNVLPGSPSALRIVLNRVVNRLRHRKIRVKFSRTNDRMRTRIVEFIR